MSDHIPDASKKLSRPQIREVFLRNSAAIPADRDDLPDWVYESVFELLDSVIQQAGPAIQYVAPAVQGEPVAYQCRPVGSQHWSECSKGEHDHLIAGKPSMDGVKREARALYTAPQTTEQQPGPDVAGLVEALKFYADGDHLMFSDKDAWDTVTGEPPNLLCDEAGTATVEDGSIARHALAAHRKGGE